MHYSALEDKKNLERPVKIFWTGGWDSTFRILELVIMEKKQVQPIYLIDPDRKSKDIEIRTMERIRKKVERDFPGAKDLILPTISHNFRDFPVNENLKQVFENLRLKKPIGIQYEWLARFCDYSGIDDIEMCIEIAAGSGVDELILPLLEKSGIRENRISEKFYDTDEYRLFHFYSFPLLTMTKKDMLDIAQKKNFLGILLKTWFCHSPIFRGATCGLCNPCKSVIKDGLGFRISFVGRVRYLFNNLVNKFKSGLKRWKVF